MRVPPPGLARSKGFERLQVVSAERREEKEPLDIYDTSAETKASLTRHSAEHSKNPPHTNWAFSFLTGSETKTYIFCTLLPYQREDKSHN